MATATRSEPHRILLTHARELRFDRTPEGVFRVVYYIPAGDRQTLRNLTARANAGHLDAAERLRSLPRKRASGAGATLTEAVHRAVMQMLESDSWAEREAVKLSSEVERYAETMGWV